MWEHLKSINLVSIIINSRVLNITNKVRCVQYISLDRLYKSQVFPREISARGSKVVRFERGGGVRSHISKKCGGKWLPLPVSNERDADFDYLKRFDRFPKH